MSNKRYDSQVLKKKKRIIISAVNFYEGGPLSVLYDCLTELDYSNRYEIIALIHRRELFRDKEYENVKFIEFPKSRKSYFYRLFYEYFYFKKLSKFLNADFWLSLHDITPNLNGIPQAVYCHNPSIFQKLSLLDLFIQPKQFLFNKFYGFLYSINIQKNKYVILQQDWIANEFENRFSIPQNKIIVSIPRIPEIEKFSIDDNLLLINPEHYNFFFPSFPREFKNFEVICEAVKLLNSKGINRFAVYITLDGTENNYAKRLFKKYKKVNNINFIGLKERTEIFNYYNQVDCLIFPSKLETWGLPITEFKFTQKPVILSNLPYAIETADGYDKSIFFDSKDPIDLSNKMERLINNEEIYTPIVKDKSLYQKTASWEELFSYIVN